MPARAPISSKIIIADDVDLIFLLITFIISFHFVPLYMLISIAITAENSKAFWFGKLISLKKKILQAINPINVNNGIKAKNKGILLFNWIMILF